MPKPSFEPRLARPRRPNTDNTIVSGEALSNVDWYSRRPHNARLRNYYSDADEEDNGCGKPASEADDEHEDADSKETAHNHVEHREGGEYKAAARGRTEKVEARRGYREAFSDQQKFSVAAFPPQSVYSKPPKAISSPGRDAKKVDWVPRTYPGAIPPSGNLLPHSGIFLPQYMNMHTSNTHAHNKGLASTKAASLIPSNIKGMSVKGAQAFNNTIEPSSPKVTCLGRVKIKHKYYKEMQKLTNMQAATCGNEKIHHSHKKGVGKDVVNMPEGGIEAAMAGGVGALNSAPALAELKRSKHGRVSHEDAIATLDPASDSETKVTKGIRRTLKEAKSHMKLHRMKNSQPPTDSMAPDHPSSHVEIAIDLGRFRSMHNVQEQDARSRGSYATLSGEYGSHDRTGFVPQVPPPNSLLLMRNSKSRAISTILASSATTEENTDGSQENWAIHNREFDASRRAYLSFLKGHSSKHSSSASLEVKVSELGVAASADGHDSQGAFLAELNVKRLCAVVAEECRPLREKQNAMAHCQASLPNANREVGLWQRRCIMKPSEIDVGRPIALQVNEPSTR